MINYGNLYPWRALYCTDKAKQFDKQCTEVFFLPLKNFRWPLKKGKYVKFKIFSYTLTSEKKKKTKNKVSSLVLTVCTRKRFCSLIQKKKCSEVLYYILTFLNWELSKFWTFVNKVGVIEKFITRIHWQFILKSIALSAYSISGNVLDS